MTTETELTLSVPEAGKRYFGLSRAASYQAAKRGDIPTIKVGLRIKRVPVRAMERKLDRLVEAEDSHAQRDREAESVQRDRVAS